MLTASQEKPKLDVASNASWTFSKMADKAFSELSHTQYTSLIIYDAAFCKLFLLLCHSCVLVLHWMATCCHSTVYCREVSIAPNYSWMPYAATGCFIYRQFHVFLYATLIWRSPQSIRIWSCLVIHWCIFSPWQLKTKRCLNSVTTSLVWSLNSLR